MNINWINEKITRGILIAKTKCSIFWTQNTKDHVTSFIIGVILAVIVKHWPWLDENGLR
jgi:hypothetical protein